MDIYNDVIKKLVGNVDPIGSHSLDESRMKNLVELSSISYSSVLDLIEVSRSKDDSRTSVRELGEYAHRSLLDLKHMIDDELDRLVEESSSTQVSTEESD